MLLLTHWQTDEVYDSMTTNGDEKRFATLNLFFPMLRRDDMTNIPKSHIVFCATSFQMADQWHDQEERQKWHKDVVVSFQENAWVNARTHIHGLCEVLGAINELLGNENSNMKGLVIEDNLSSHKTESAENFWAKDLKNFSFPVYVPPNMTSFLQVVDRHIGIRYKYYVYLMYRKEMWNASMK